MQALKTLLWIVITVILVSFVAMNWTTAPVNFWPLEDAYLHFEWPVGLTALLFFLLGLVPMWLIARANTWRLKRRIQSLETSLRAAASISPVESETAAIEHEPVSPAADPADPALHDEPRAENRDVP